MKVSTKLILGFGLLIALMVGLLAFHFTTLREIATITRELSVTAPRLLVGSAVQLRRLDYMQETARKYHVTGDLRYAGRFEEARRDFGSAIAELDELALTGTERQAIRSLRVAWEAFLARTADVDRRLAPGPEGAARLEELEPHFTELKRRSRRVQEALQTAVLGGLRRAADAARETQHVSWGALGGVVLLSLLISAAIIRSIARPLERLKAGTHAVAEGNFRYRLWTPGRDEFSQLGRDFNAMTRRLEELDQAKRDFLSRVSHDLKTPLASMQEATAVLLDGIPGPLDQKQRRLLELSRRSGERLSGMISKLLDLARTEAGVMEYEFREVDLRALVAGVLEEFEPALAERGLRVATRLPRGPLRAVCDEERMVQVVGNLLENAVKFSPAGGSIDVRLRRVVEPPAGAPTASRVGFRGRGLAHLEVADEGPGIPDGAKEKVFEKFQQLESGGGVGRRGVGLGLALCREVVTAHGGWIWSADRPGTAGACLHVLLPGLVEGDGADAPEGEGAGADAPEGRGVGAAAEGRPTGTSAARGALRGPLAVLLAWSAAAALAGCGASRFDRLFEAGQYEEAAAVYEADPALQGKDRALYRAALMHALPDSPVHDPERAVRELERLLAGFPESPYREPAMRHLSMLREVVRLRSEVRESSGTVRRLEEELASLRERNAELEEEVAEREDYAGVLRQLIEELREDVAAREEEVRALEEELERLKTIDLGETP